MVTCAAMLDVGAANVTGRSNCSKAIERCPRPIDQEALFRVADTMLFTFVSMCQLTDQALLE